MVPCTYRVFSRAQLWFYGYADVRLLQVRPFSKVRK